MIRISVVRVLTGDKCAAILLECGRKETKGEG